mgnify:CR=1 FL=1
MVIPFLEGMSWKDGRGDTPSDRSWPLGLVQVMKPLAGRCQRRCPKGHRSRSRCPAFPQHDGQMEAGKGAYRDIVALVTCPKVKDGPESVLETCNGNEGRIAATM